MIINIPIFFQICKGNPLLILMIIILGFISINLNVSAYSFKGNVWETKKTPVKVIPYYDHSIFDDLKPSPLPVHGEILYYNPGIMDKVWRNKYINLKYPICNECVGFVAMMRNGDLQSKICIQRDGSSEIEGPFHVIDVAGESAKSALIARGWIVDVDWNTSRAWGMRGPINGTLLTCPQNMKPLLIKINPSSNSTGVLMYRSNIRAGAGMGKGIVAVMPKGSVVNIYGMDPTKLWYLIDKEKGWYVSSGLVMTK